MAPSDNGTHSILSANDADHSRYRRLLSHAFSERALLQQEHLLMQYIDLLIERLQGRTASTGIAIVDVVQWFNFVSFDIIGDLALGESFHCLDESRYHSWVSNLFTQFKTAALFVCCRFCGLGKFLRYIVPRSMLKKRRDNVMNAKQKVWRRLEQKHEDAQRNDFMTYVLRYNDEKGMSVLEIEATFGSIVVAGSETTATALSGIIHYLLRYPEHLDALTTEVRRSFAHHSEISSARVGKLPYLGAVIEEGLRLCPPVPLGMPRVVPGNGTSVAGEWLPEGVSGPLYTLFLLFDKIR